MCSPLFHRIVIALLAIAFPAAAAPGQTIWYVDADAGGANDGSSWADAFIDLQDALAAAQAEDEIWVAAGAYRPDRGTRDRALSFTLVDGTALYGGFEGTETDRDQRDPAGNPTVLSGDLAANDGPDFANYEENSYHVVVGEALDPTTILSGFTITGGNADVEGETRGGGIMLHGASAYYGSYVVVTNCTVKGNRATRGGGVSILSGSPRFTDCTFLGNEGVDGGALWTIQGYWHFVTFTRCTFVRNTSERAGGAVYLRSFPYDEPRAFRFTDCGFFGNQAGTWGGAVHEPSSGPVVHINCVFSGNVAGEFGGACCLGGNDYMATLINCTFSSNAAPLGGGAYIAGNWPRFTNCVLWGNQDASGSVESAQIHLYNTYARINYSCVQGWTGTILGEHNIDADPLFVNPVGSDGIVGTPDDDLRLQAASPCIDAGDNEVDTDLATYFTVARIPHFDLDGYARVTDYPPMPDTGNGRAPIVDMGAFEYQDCNANAVPDPQDIAEGTSLDHEPNGIPDECQDILYVDVAAGGANSGMDWDDAFTDLQDALAIAGIGDEIWVAAGTYGPDRGTGDQSMSFRLPWAVRVLGGFAGWETQRDERDPDLNRSILSGDLAGNDGPGFLNYQENALHVVRCVDLDAAAMLDGFTVTGGNGDHGGGIRADYASPTIARCAIERNLASDSGGGIYSDEGAPILSCCRLANNHARYGGAFAGRGETGDPQFEDCVFEGNSAEGDGGALGLYKDGWSLMPVVNGPALTRCRVVANQAGRSGGGLWAFAPRLRLHDCHFFNNIAAQDGGGFVSYAWEPVPAVHNCTFSYNQAFRGGGIALLYRDGFDLRNCILWGNQDETGTGESAQIDLGSWLATINYTCIQGWTGALGGVGNMGDNPLLKADGLHLIRQSPCRNAGDPDLRPASGETDLDGQPRVIDGRVDMGADEWLVEPLAPEAPQPMGR